jgi:hypothetical protein
MIGGATPKSRSAVAERWVSLATVTFAALAVALAAVSLIATGTAVVKEHFALGGDFGLYEEAARRWLGGGGFYLPQQLAGPYEIGNGSILYPPVSLLLFVPFLWLPPVLWWVIPAAIVGWILVSLRPAPWTWPLIAFCLANPWSIQLTHSGNPTIWIAAFVALSIRWPWVAALVLLKPSLFPLALIGIRSRSWWVAAGVLGAVSLLLWPMTLDWLHAVFDGRGPYSGLLYSWAHAPMAATALVAWLGSEQRADHADGRLERRVRLGRGRAGDAEEVAGGREVRLDRGELVGRDVARDAERRHELEVRERRLLGDGQRRRERVDDDAVRIAHDIRRQAEVLPEQRRQDERIGLI